MGLRIFRWGAPGEYVNYVRLRSYFAWSLQMTRYEHKKIFFAKMLKFNYVIGIRIVLHTTNLFFK